MPTDTTPTCAVCGKPEVYYIGKRGAPGRLHYCHSHSPIRDVPTHQQAIDAAKQNGPPQSWYDEDVTGLRGPRLTAEELDRIEREARDELAGGNWRPSPEEILALVAMARGVAGERKQ